MALSMPGSPGMVSLPELWNVVKSDIGWVGVKNTPLTDEERLSSPWQQQFVNISPGFTGLWYVESETGTGADESVDLDAFYLATRSWQEDVRLLWRTPSAWIRRVRGQPIR